MTAPGDFTLTLAGGLHLERSGDRLTLRFTDEALGGGRTLRRAVCGSGPLTLDLVADRASLEFYCNDGTTVFSTRFYPAEPAVSLCLQGADAVVQPLHPMTFSLA
ncbi:hypothetical protein SUBVAR_06782 [Subdoligranulum variabile DSM 15176]|uniref:Glycosyl hydrolase family 32 C-terminal domain-containing protein n=2 Tax=Subdoligranulum variabile TaxID=214851 RepID=D1PQV5_9FIRM|nr:hypothetical protein SUBVAR_06782 [Subdoligranulum variabile DSM 15176]